jgi:hypothetical protein
MMLFDVMKKAFDDELQKIAGALQGHVRCGRRPISATTLLDKEKEETKATRKKVADLTKLSGGAQAGKNLSSKLSPDAKSLGLLGIGAYGLYKAQQAKRRHDLGLQVEMQQRQGMGF